MAVALRQPRMTREQFFAWAQADGGRWEFDGFEPVAMTGGNNRHSLMTVSLHVALHTRLRGSGCRSIGPDAGLRTIGEAVRYPDALVTCTKVDGAAHEVPGVVAVCEVLSPTSGHTDRIVKLREYAAVPTIRRYVIVEQASVAATLHVRDGEGADWTVTAITAGQMIDLPEVGIAILLDELYADTDLAA